MLTAAGVTCKASAASAKLKLVAARREVPRFHFATAHVFQQRDQRCPIGSRTGRCERGRWSVTSVLAAIASEVYTIERVPALAERALRALQNGLFPNVSVRTGDGALGWADAAPFDPPDAPLAGGSFRNWRRLLRDNGVEPRYRWRSR